MKRVLFVLGMAVPLSGAGNEQAINRALVERDQRTAEFAAGVSGNVDRRALELLHQRQLFDVRPLHPDPEVARQLAPYQREQMAREREGFILRLPPPTTRDSLDKPLPLPGGDRDGVEPIPSNRVEG